MTLLEAKNNGAYILVKFDKIKNYTGYSIVHDVNNTEKIIYCELNRSAFLKAKNEMGFTFKIQQTSFLNSVPFAVENNEKTPLMQTYIN